MRKIIFTHTTNANGEIIYPDDILLFNGTSITDDGLNVTGWYTGTDTSIQSAPKSDDNPYHVTISNIVTPLGTFQNNILDISSNIIGQEITVPINTNVSFDLTFDEAPGDGTYRLPFLLNGSGNSIFVLIDVVGISSTFTSTFTESGQWILSEDNIKSLSIDNGTIGYTFDQLQIIVTQ